MKRHPNSWQQEGWDPGADGLTPESLSAMALCGLFKNPLEGPWCALVFLYLQRVKRMKKKFGEGMSGEGLKCSPEKFRFRSSQ